MVVNHGGELTYQEASVQRGYGASTNPQFDTSKAKALSPQIMALLVMTALKRCWKWALFIGLIASTVGAGLVWFITPVKYEATALIYAAQKPEYLIFKNESGSGEYSTFIATQWDLIQSSKVLEVALDDNKVRSIPALLNSKDPVDTLAKKIRLSRKKSSSLFSISYQDEVAENAYAVVHAVTEAYINRQKESLDSSNDRILGLLKSEREYLEILVKNLQKDIKTSLKQAAEKGGGGSTMGGITQGMQQQSMARECYTEEAKLRYYEVELKVEQELSTRDQEIPAFIVKNRIETSQAYQNHQAYIQQLAAKLHNLSQKVSKKDPSVVRLKKEYLDAESERDTLYAKLESAVRKQIHEEWQHEVNMRIIEKKARIDSQKILVQELKKGLNEQMENFTQSTAESADVTFQMSQLNRHNRILEMLNERFVALSTEKLSPQRVQKYQDAKVPRVPIRSPRIMMTGAVGVGLFFAPFVLGIALEFMKPKVYHVSQVRGAVPGLLIGEIMEPPVAWLHGAAFRRRLARYRESVHNWCTHLLLADPFRHCQTMAVASVAGDDGKTFLAIQVASAMAQMKSGPVLLIDGDMRIGRLHLLFGNEESGPGLADVLSFRKGIGEAVTMNEKEPNLHLLSAGNLDVSPYEILGDGRFRELLDALSTHYSMIMVVVPPVSHAAESLMMASSVDTVILCVRQGVTVMAAMEDVYRKLVTTGSHVDGIVVKDIPFSHMSSKDGGFSDKIEQIRLAHLLKQTETI